MIYVIDKSLLNAVNTSCMLKQKVVRCGWELSTYCYYTPNSRNRNQFLYGDTNVRMSRVEKTKQHTQSS
jgi:hypothetical protein